MDRPRRFSCRSSETPCRRVASARERECFLIAVARCCCRRRRRHRRRSRSRSRSRRRRRRRGCSLTLLLLLLANGPTGNTLYRGNSSPRVSASRGRLMCAGRSDEGYSLSSSTSSLSPSSSSSSWPPPSPSSPSVTSSRECAASREVREASERLVTAIPRRN